jgi:glycosyltransferase involved in cell wall biosynthesis
MRIWIVTIGEPLPIPDPKQRLIRSGILSRFLVNQGHTVVWWGSTFDHSAKRHRFERDTDLELSERLRLVLFHGCGYQRNISFRRALDHRQVARKFAAAIERETQKPDVIFSGFPPIEMCAESVRYGAKNGVPVVVDIRDLWPDIFVDVAPKPLRRMTALALSPLFRKTDKALRDCDGLIGISRGYLDWGLRRAGRAQRNSDGLFPLGYLKPESSVEGMSSAKDSLLKLGVDPSKTICWFAGTFGHNYDLAPVIIAARRYEERGRRDVQFVLSGSGEKEITYRAMAKGLQNTIFTGWIDAPQIACLLSFAKLGLAAYVRGAPQSLPNKLFEYMSAGIPVLSSLGVEAQDFLERAKCGITYLAGDADDFVHKLDWALRNPHELESMGQRGKALFEREFSAHVIYPKIEDFLRQHARARR